MRIACVMQTPGSCHGIYNFDRGGSLANLLTDFIVEHDFVVCDLSSPAPQSLCRHLLLTPELNLTLFGLKPPLPP